jgi:hypothetical protein
MSFIKRGDGKILNIFDEKDLSDDQKKSMKKISNQNIKKSELIEDDSEKESIEEEANSGED